MSHMKKLDFVYTLHTVPDIQIGPCFWRNFFKLKMSTCKLSSGVNNGENKQKRISHKDQKMVRRKLRRKKRCNGRQKKKAERERHKNQD